MYACIYNVDTIIKYNCSYRVIVKLKIYINLYIYIFLHIYFLYIDGMCK